MSNQSKLHTAAMLGFLAASGGLPEPETKQQKGKRPLDSVIIRKRLAKAEAKRKRKNAKRLKDRNTMIRGQK